MRRDYEREILNAVNESSVPVGAIFLSELLGIPSANIGRVLLRLEQDGMVEKVQNKGRKITDKGKIYLEAEKVKSNKISVANELIASVSADDQKTLLDILQARLLLEGYTAQHCALNITEEQKSTLKDIHFDYIYELRHGRIGSENDLKLHLAIAEFAGNGTVERILRLILTDKDTYAKFNKAALGVNGLRQDEHLDIIDAICENDGEKAKKAMENHLKHVIANVENFYVR